IQNELADHAQSDGVAGALRGRAHALGAKKPNHSAPKTTTASAKLTHRTMSTGRSRNPARASTLVSTFRPDSSRMVFSLRASTLQGKRGGQVAEFPRSAGEKTPALRLHMPHPIR